MQLLRGGRLLKVLAVWAACALTIIRSSEAAEPYRIYVVEPALSNHAICPHGALPETCKLGTRIEMMAARGEFEPASFLVETEQPLLQLRVHASELRGDGRRIPAKSIDIRVVAPFFRDATLFPITMNWILVHDPNLIQVRDEPQPRSLRPGASEVDRAHDKTNYFTRRPVDADSLQAADVSHRQQFWITVRVPEDAEAGTYRGTLTISANNQADRHLDLELRVASFALAEPDFEYSVYHPVWLEGNLPADNRQGYAVLSADQYLADLKNMVAHGCRNPVIYTRPLSNPDGTLDFSHLETVLRLREQLGMPKDRLYLLGAGSVISSQKIDAEQYRRNVRQVRELVAYLKGRGYGEIHLMGCDEATGEALMSQRAAWQSIHDAGAKVFVAHYAGYTEGIADLLDVPVMLHPMHTRMDRLRHMPADRFVSIPPEVQEGLDVNLLLKPEVQDKIRRVHQAGHRVLSYMDSWGSDIWVEHHRRMRGLGLWKANLDGSMTWAYTHITQPRYQAAGPFDLWNGFVLRGAVASFDTLSWEAYREGYDDARYLATLRRAISGARKKAQKQQLVRETEQWLNSVDMGADLNSWRREMARRIEELLSES